MKILFYQFCYDHNSFFVSSQRITSHQCNVTTSCILIRQILIIDLFRIDNKKIDNLIFIQITFSQYLYQGIIFELRKIFENCSIRITFSYDITRMSKQQRITFFSWRWCCRIFYDSLIELFVKIRLSKISSLHIFIGNDRDIQSQRRDNNSIYRRCSIKRKIILHQIGLKCFFQRRR
jgi:hypothetical protein